MSDATVGRDADRLITSCDEAVEQLGTFDAVIDVRSQAEFADDHIPGAWSAPVLDDAERSLVGTLHKQVGAFEARRRGAALVAGNIARLLDQRFADFGRDWRPLVYCWRGGQRSAALTHVLARVGWRARQLEGGYRAFRRRVMADLDQLPGPLKWIVIAGPTGSGKSFFLQQLTHAGAQVLDLERLARHRGSVLGGLPSEPQPSQRRFETLIWQTLRQFDPGRPVYVESESRKVGERRIPDALIGAIRSAACVQIALPLAARVQLLRREYAHFEATPSALIAQLNCLEPLHGRTRIREWTDLVNAARWDELVARLLQEHYDPAYRRSLSKNYPSVQHAKAMTIEADDPTALTVVAQSWAHKPPQLPATPA